MCGVLPGFGVAAIIDAHTKLLAGLEKGHTLGRHLHSFTCAWVAALAGITEAHRESTKAAQLHTVAALKRCGDFFEDHVNGLFNTFQRQVRVFL